MRLLTSVLGSHTYHLLSVGQATTTELRCELIAANERVKLLERNLALIKSDTETELTNLQAKLKRHTEISEGLQSELEEVRYVVLLPCCGIFVPFYSCWCCLLHI